MKIKKYYGLCISEERRKNLEKYENIFNIEIDTSLSENALEKNLDYYKKTKQIVQDWRGTLGAVGCTISFCNIYKDIVKNKYEYSIIFEDDIDWNEEFYGECNAENFQNQLDKIDFDSDWDIFYLGTENKGFVEEQTHINDNIYELQCGRIEIPIEDDTFESFNKSRKSNKLISHGNFGGQQAFILTYNGALQLLKYHDPAYEISDGLVSYAIMNGDLINRSFIPTLFTQLSHPRIPGLSNKLWTSLTGVDNWITSEKYSNNMTKIKKGCSGWPLSKKYDRDYKRPQYKIEEK
jgi:GR25 family glycosyltransferase involved in LPS biosynthesis